MEAPYLVVRGRKSGHAEPRGSWSSSARDELTWCAARELTDGLAISMITGVLATATPPSKSALPRLQRTPAQEQGDRYAFAAKPIIRVAIVLAMLSQL